MPSHLEFIVFAIQQAREAEAFGFTRNECCRNLKTALHQYWQNKTLGLHGQSQKAKLPRSKAAQEKPLSECDVEHCVPQMVIVNALMNLEEASVHAVEEILKKHFRVLLITKEEHQRLNASGLRSNMPIDWDEEDTYARYRSVGIDF